MENFLFYIGKVAIAAGAFYLAYLVLFQNQKHFGFNRIYLPVSLFLSFLIPLITFTSIQYVEPVKIDYNNITYIDKLPAGTISETGFTLMWYHYLFGIYFLGIAGFFFHLLLGHLKAIQIVRKSRIQKIFESIVNITKKDVHPFSFFNKIVLSEKTLDSKNLEMIVSHEKIHVEEKHTLDILFTEIMFLFQWFNPFAWLLKDAIQNNLEYKTDHQVTQKFDAQEYQMAMVGLADKEGVAPFLTALNGSQLKNRIIMMKKKTKNRYGLLKQMVVLPLLAVLVMGLSNKEIKTEFLPESVNNGSTTKNIVVVVDGKIIPSDSEKLSHLDLSHNWNGGQITDALGIDENKIESNGVIINENPDEIIYYVRTSDYVEGSNAEFDKFFEETGVENSADKQTKKPTKTVYAIDGELKTDEEINNLDNYKFESATVLDGKTATDKYGEAVKDASVVDLTTGEPRIILSFHEEIPVSKTDTTQKNALNDVIGIRQTETQTVNTEYNVKGKVSDENGKPLSGVAVIIRGKPVGTMTDSDGNYILNLENETLIYKIPGYKSREMKVKAGETVNVQLTEDKNQKQDSIKVIGYGRLPGNASQLRFRNTENDGQPLIVFDGEIIDDINSISPSEIKSITVLKDATAVALYGEEARNGVIIITSNEFGLESLKDLPGNPLIIVDGKKFKSIDESEVGPGDIENITVLKDAAEKFYGKEAKDGAVIITRAKNNKKDVEQFNAEQFIIRPQELNKNPQISGTLSGDNPLIVVNGKEFKTVEEADVKPEEIESMTVLKKETATRIYGESAKDGAIIITKKANELNNFLISLEIKKNTAKLKGLNGCAFKELSFTLTDNNPVYIDSFGMTPDTGKSSSEFLFGIEKKNNQIVLTAKEGTAWKNLSFTPANSLLFINEHGISKEK